MREQKDRIIVALDTPTLEECEELIQELQGVISYFKIGFELFTAHGWKAVEKVKKTGAKIFLDLKLHDIPNTVAKTAQVICDHDVDMFNVHALGGLEMMQRTREAVDQKSGTK
ncbi:MAG: orotidine 5'-phosphate decarboxylase, partial [Candidatus Omnitrophica bacterium]|nr:orotidine 5'-phosphate decarboxylase [Candidatus Omnitrophota bacterium]